jgi:Carboxypeptidase regulatory-like domain/TonB dependent receptor
MMKHLVRSFLLAILAAGVGHAQQLATLSVTVADPSGKLIVGAGVSLNDTNTGLTRNGQTNRAGLAVLTAIAAGDYELTIKADGFGVWRQPLTLTVGQTASIPVQMRVAAVKESVIVSSAGAEGIDTEKTEASDVIHPSQIDNLPISDRDFIDFVLLTPNANVGRSTVTAAQSTFQESVLQLSFGGLRETHSVFFGLDGTDYSVSLSGVQHVSPSLDWVQEFRVIDGPYTADNGRNLGAVVETITKSGGNDVHGSAYEYFRNGGADAKNPLSDPGFDALRFNQFGADLGGPIRHDKTIYFAGYEGQRQAQSPLYSTFILGCINTPGCMGPGTPSINQVKQMFGLQPEQLNSILEIDNYDKAIGKITQFFDERNILSAGYLFTDDRKMNTPSSLPGQGLPSSFRNNPVRDQTVYGSYLHLFGPRLTSESVIDYGQRVFNLTPQGAGFEPSLDVSDVLVTGGFIGSVAYYQEHHFEAQENLTLVRGANTFRFGGGFEPIWNSADPYFFSPGGAIFTPQSFFGTGPFAGPPFGPGTPVEFLFLEPRSYFGDQVPTRPVPFSGSIYAGPAAPAFEKATSQHFWHRQMNFYAQDMWKVSQKLTVTAGLRYDLDLFPSATDLGLVGPMIANNFGNLQPRVGVAYAFNGGRDVVRAGFGLFTGPWDYSGMLIGGLGSSAFTKMSNPLVTNLNTPNGLMGFGPTGIVGVSGPFLSSQAFSNFVSSGEYPAPGELQQFAFGYLQRKFPNAYAEKASLEEESQLGAGWYLTLGYQFIHALDLATDLSINGLPDGTLPDGRQAFTPADPNFGFALDAAPIGYSIYHAGTVTVHKNFAGHYSVLGNYTWSKSIDIETDLQLSDVPQDYLDPNGDRSVGDNDVRHRATISFLAESPDTWPEALRNLKLSMANTLQSPRYFSILAGFNVNGDGYPFSDRTGTVGRNSYRGASYYDSDLRLQRAFQIRDRFSADASIEGFNLFNHRNVQSIDQVYGAPDFLGPVPRQFGDGIGSPANPTFAQPNFAGPARQLQASLRFDF